MNNQDDRKAAVPPYTHAYIEEDELQIIARRRARLYPCAEKTSANLIGLALSGGGIRSAISNLGLLYELARVGLFKAIDYMSTVSGGGYIGCCLSALLSLRNPEETESNKGSGIYTFSDSSQDTALFSSDWASFPFRDKPFVSPTSKAGDMSEPSRQDEEFCEKFSSQSQIYHLRNLASYLMPRSLLFSSDTMRMIGATISTTFLSLLWFISLTTLFSSLYMLATLPQWHSEITAAVKLEKIKEPAKLQIGEAGDWNLSFFIESVSTTAGNEKQANKKSYTERARESLENINTSIHKQWDSFFSQTLSKISVWYCVLFLLALYLLRRVTIRLAGPKWGNNPVLNETQESYYFRLKLKIEAQFTIGSLLVVLYSISFWTFASPPDSFPDGRLLLLPAMALFLLLCSTFSFLCCSLTERYHGTDLLKLAKNGHNRTNSPRIHRGEAAISTGVHLYALLGTLILATMPAVIRVGNSQFMAIVIALLTVAIKFYLPGKKQEKEKKDKANKAVIAKVIQWLTALAVPFFIILVIIATCCLILNTLSPWYNGVESSDITPPAVLTFFYTLTLISAALALLFSYCDFNRISPHTFYMDRLSEAFLQTYRAIRPVVEQYTNEETRILAVRNSIEMDLENLHGNTSKTSASPVERCAARGPYLLINATLNLTAVRDLKGFRRQATDFLFSRCYIGSDRTGYVSTQTYQNPSVKVGQVMAISGAAITSVRGAGGSLLESFACTIFGVRLGYWLRNPASLVRNSFIATWHPMNLFYELFRYTNTSRDYIYLSDGGHCGDNLGLMPLFRRKVKLVIASDAECDPDHLFDSLNNSIRRAYVDENIKITINLDDLMPDGESGLTKKYFTIGRVFYPDRPWQKSWLLVIKNTMTGRESAPIRNYKRKSPDFPHETTVDQFFTEEQFEVYRSLGRESCREIWEKCINIFRTEQWLKDPWSQIDEFCETLMDDCLYQPGHRDKELQKNAPWEKENDCWDDIVRSIWRCEIGNFSNWQGFKATIDECYNKMTEYFQKQIGNNPIQFDGEMERQFQELKRWLDAHQEKLNQFTAIFDVPRNWRQFLEIRDQASHLE